MDKEQSRTATNTNAMEQASTPPADSVTRHKLQIDGRTLEYTATAGTLDVEDMTQQASARIFYVAYTVDPRPQGGSRPVAFAYNGGPGAASAYLHMGAWGPKRIEVHTPGSTPPAPYRLVDNRHTLLASTDLVFIDPVGTGYSHVLGDTPRDAFFGVESDVSSIGEFIRRYLSRSGRWNSPKFLAGESYGTTRSALLVDALQRRFSVDFNGVILISSILDFETMDFDPGNDMPYPLYLPTYAATAHYHDALASRYRAQDLQPFLEQVRDFARSDYTAALMAGDALGERERQRVARRLAALSGLEQGYWLTADLRVTASRFRKRLLHRRQEVVGRYDSRYSGADLDAVASAAGYDPTSAAIDGAYTAAINTHLHQDLEYGRDRQYVVLNPQAIERWRWLPSVPGYDKAYYIDVARNLRSAMIRNPYLQVFFGKGYYDLATPFHATEYTIRHMALPPALRSNITLRHYPAGHMLYLRDQDQAALNTDLTAFIASATRSE